MRIASLNFNPNSGRVKVVYEERANDGHDLVRATLTSKDEPHPNMVSALADLQPHVSKLCGLPAKYVESVRGLSIKHDEDDPELVSVGFIGTHKISSSNAPLVLNTPPVVPEGKVSDLVAVLVAEAKAYVRGRRAQGELLETTGTSSDAGLLDDVEEPDAEDADDVAAPEEV